MNFSNLSKAQLLYSYNAEETVVRPIDWVAITHANAPPKTPKDVRDYLNLVVARMNQHLAVVMHGPMTGKIMVTRQSRIAGTESIFVSVWRAQSLFPRKIQLNWLENGRQRTLFKTALDVWLRSSARKEVMPAAHVESSSKHPVVQWLKAELSPPDEVSLLLYRGLNPRRALLESFYQTLRMPEQWPPKRFWQALYGIVPQSRPAKHTRVKLRGVDCVFLPSREDIVTNIAAYEQHSSYGRNVTF